jgi:adenine/guanine phosphoribosyltransferase-like PRPP-binding protein
MGSPERDRSTHPPAISIVGHIAGKDAFVLPLGAIQRGQRVVVVDDLLATGVFMQSCRCAARTD